jgi:PAS domain S-box-containing protein
MEPSLRSHDRQSVVPEAQNLGRLQAENAELRRRLEAAEEAIEAAAVALAQRKTAEQRLAVEHGVSRLLARATHIDEAVPGVLEAIRDGLRVDFCALWLPDEGGQALRCARYVTVKGAPDLGRFVEATRDIAFAPGGDLPGRAWQSGRAVLVDAQGDDESFPRFAAALAAGLRIGVAAPLPSDGGCLGVIELFCRESWPCEPALLATMEAIGAEVGQFLLRKRAEATIEVRARQQQGLASLGMAAIYEGDLQKVFDQAVEMVGRILGVEMCKVLELLPDGKEVFLRAGIGWQKGLVGRATVSTGLDSQAGYTLATDEPVIVKDLRTETRFHGPRLLHDHGVVSGLSCIIPGSEERAWGVLGAHTTRLRCFTRDDVAFLQGVANVLAASIQRRRVEDELRASEAKLSAVLDALPVGVVIADAEGRLVRDNAAHRELWGMPPETASWEGYGEWVGYWPETGQRIKAHEWAMARALLKRETVRGELVQNERFGAGERRTYLNNAAPILDAHGNLIGGVVAELDVTEMRQAEERYRLVNRATNDVIWDWDFGTDELRWNEALDATFGYRLADVPREIRWWYDHLHPDDRDRVVRGIHAVIDGGGDAWHDEYRFRRADGTYARVLDRGHIHREAGRPVRMIGSMLDLTERLAAEQALRESESFYRQTLESIPGMTFTNTPDGSCIYISEQWVEFTGVPSAEQLGEGWLTTLHPDDRDRAFAAWRAAVEGRGEYDLEYRVRRHDGSYEWFKVRGRAIHDQSGRIVRWFGTAVNVNNLKLAEVALKEADQRKDEFLAMLAHELRNPLAPIRNAVQILQLAGPKEPRLDRAREMIERQVKHLVRLVDDLLDVSRVSRGKITLQKEPLELLAVVRQAVETSRPLLDARHHELTVALPPEPVRVEGDFTRLAQVVSNLLNNAAKYTDDGGRIGLSVEQGETEAVIRVRDSGRGIDPRALGSLFDLFYQVDRNLDRADGGLGIGLSLVKSLVEMHGGRVEAHSDGRGRGSEFTVRLPGLPAEPPSRREKALDGPTAAARGLRILVVDDNRDSVETMAMLLELEGHEALTAYDGKKAVEIALTERPAVVLLDIGLPHLDGYQACRAMREGGLTDALLVAMTGYGQEQDRRLSQEAGFDAHHVKPIDLPTIRELLAKRAAASVTTPDG